MGFKTLAEAIALRNRALLHLEIAESLDDPEQRREYLTFVFVGAGYAGVEGIAELQDMVADVIDRYPRCRIDGTRWILVEATGPDHARDRAAAGRVRHRRAARPRDRGSHRHEPRIGRGGRRHALDRRADPDAHRVLDRRRRAAAARARTRPAARRRRPDRGRADAAREGPGERLGDRRRGRRPGPGGEGERPTPPTAQHALRQGRLVADNVAAALGHGKLAPFRYKTRGVFVDMGRHKAVVSTPVVRFRGFPAWFAARTYHMLMMPGLGRKLRLVVDWTVGLLLRPRLGRARPARAPAGARGASDGASPRSARRSGHGGSSASARARRATWPRPSRWRSARSTTSQCARASCRRARAQRRVDPVALAAPAEHPRVPRRPAGRALLDRRGRRSHRRLRAHRPVRGAWRS